MWGAERDFWTYSDSSFKVVLVRPNSSTINSSIKKNNPLTLLIIYASSKNKVCPLVKLTLSLVSRNLTEFSIFGLVRLKPQLWVWLMFLTIFFLVIQSEFNASTRVETVHNLRHCNHKNTGFKFNILYLGVANKIGRRSSKLTLQTRDRLSGRIIRDRNVWSWL